MLRALCLFGLALILSACVTTPPGGAAGPSPSGSASTTSQPPAGTSSQGSAHQAPISPSTPAPTPSRPQISPDAPPLAAPTTTSPLPSPANDFAQLQLWQQTDPRLALSAFARSCQVWETKNPSAHFSASHPEFGKLSDWASLCPYARLSGNSPQDARRFFETYFAPLTASAQGEGLLTGYYQPELPVRARPDAEYSEAILAVPENPADQKRARADIKPYMSRVIAYGRPIDVFFMQVQGSGIIVFDNGYRVRAAYAGNNGKNYSSIGGVLVRRGVMTRSQASKQAIEDWMSANGPEAAQALMNENKRYIFFKEQNLVPGEGPQGGMRVPLTAMGSLAVDPKFNPYGLPIWLNVKLPQYGGDYKGQTQGLLVIAQDTGKAIKGRQRGDIYFGSGYDAGAKAGVMKHTGSWTLLVPRTVSSRPPVS